MTSSCGRLPVREGDQLVQPLAGGAGVDDLARDLEALAQVGRVAAGGDRAGRVEQDRRASPAVPAREDLADVSGVLLRAAASQLVGVAALDAQVERVDLATPDVAVGHLADEGRAGGRELVDAARA